MHFEKEIPLNLLEEILTDDEDLFYKDFARDFYLEGRRDHWEGMTLEECPYPEEKPSTLWKMGWQSATVMEK